MESNVVSEPTSPEEKESLTVGLAILSDRISTLEGALNKHCGRLDLVLAPSPTSTPGTVAQDQISSEVAPVVLRIQELTYKLEDMVDHLQRVSQRLRI